MLMVIFGAGASYDSFAEYPPAETEIAYDHPHYYQSGERPPLAQNLFATRYGDIAARYPECQGLFPRLRRAESVEEELERILGEATLDSSVLIELIALRYYIRDAIQEVSNGWAEFTSRVTNYSALLRELRTWRAGTNDEVCLVTFNYDDLLDDAWRGVLHWGTNSMPAYVGVSNWSLLKLHGSIDWKRRADNIDMSAFEEVRSMNEEFGELTPKGSKRLAYISAVRSAARLTWTGEYRTAEENPAHGLFDNNRESAALWLPAIAMPTQTKTAFECPAEHLVLLRNVIPRVTKLLIVGWRGAEQHFLSEWRGTKFPTGLQRIQIVSGGERDGQEVYDNLVRFGITCADVRFSSLGFSAFVLGADLRGFLAAD